MPFTIEDFEDLLRLLELHPEWRGQLRRLLLTEELLTVPERLSRLEQFLVERARQDDERGAQLGALIEAVRDNSGQIRELRETVAEHSRQIQELREIVAAHTEQIRELRETVAEHSRQIRELRETVAEHSRQIQELRETVTEHTRQLRELTQQVQALTRTVQILADRLDKVAERGDRTLGMVLELRAEQRLSSWLGRLMRGLRVRPPGQWDRDLVQLVGRDAFDRLLDADLIGRGRLNGDEEARVWIVVEVSYVIDDRDVERAWQWARLMQGAGLKVIPVVLGAAVAAEAREQALRAGVLIVEADLQTVRTEGWEQARTRWVA